MPYTSHGWWIGRGTPTRPAPARVNCRGPHLCPACALEAQRMEEGVMQPPRLGASPEDVRQMTAMFRVVGLFGQRLAQVCDAAAEALEDITGGDRPRPTLDEPDDVAQQRADDDGWPPTD